MQACEPVANIDSVAGHAGQTHVAQTTTHVGPDALVWAAERSSAIPEQEKDSDCGCPGCPILARFLRKGGDSTDLSWTRVSHPYAS